MSREPADWRAENENNPRRTHCQQIRIRYARNDDRIRICCAKKHPDSEVKVIIESVTKGKQIVEEKKIEPEKIIEENIIDFDSIDSRILKISAEIDLIQSEEIPEFKRLKLISSLRILQSRTQLALSSLNIRATSLNLLGNKVSKK